MFTCSAVFCASVGKYAKQIKALLLIEWQNLIIKHICCYQCIFTVIHFSKGYTAISINKGLLIDFPYSFYVSNIICILCTKIAGMMGFNFPFALLLFFFSF